MKILRNAYFGILCSVLCSVSYTFSTVILKKVPHFDSVPQSFLGSFWMIVGSLPMVVYARKNIFGRPLHPFLTFLRAAVGAIALFLAVIASRYLPLAEIAIIYSTTPGVSSIVARVILKEKCNMAQTISLLLAAAGALIATCFRILTVQSEAVSIVTIIRSCSDVVVALLFQMVFFQHFPHAYEWCGSATVLVSAGVISWDKWKNHRTHSRTQK